MHGRRQNHTEVATFASAKGIFPAAFAARGQGWRKLRHVAFLLKAGKSQEPGATSQQEMLGIALLLFYWLLASGSWLLC
jgi:hypothetical protein